MIAPESILSGYDTSRSPATRIERTEGIIGRWARGAEHTHSRLAQFRALSVLLVGFFSFVISSAVSLLVRKQ